MHDIGLNKKIGGPKIIIQLSIDNDDEIARFSSYVDAARAILEENEEIKSSIVTISGGISSCCKGKLKTSYGYRWKLLK